MVAMFSNMFFCREVLYVGVLLVQHPNKDMYWEKKNRFPLVCRAGQRTCLVQHIPLGKSAFRRQWFSG